MSRPTHVPLAVLVVGFSFSLAANILWCWPGGPVRILGGALASVAVPAAIHMWPHVRATSWPAKLLRNTLMTAIASLAAVTTFVHAARLLVAHGEDPWLAAAYPVITELLVVLAVLAHRGPATGTRSTNRVKSSPARGKRTERAPITPAPAAAPTPLASRRTDHAARVAWLAARKPESFAREITALCERFHISASTAKRIRREVGGRVAS